MNCATRVRRSSLGNEARALEQATRQDGEPDFNLVQPRAVARCVNEANPVSRVLEKCAACLLRLEDTGLALRPEFVLDAAPMGHEFDERCGTVSWSGSIRFASSR